MSHEFRSLHGGKACLALVADGIHGDLCGQPADHPIHQVPVGNDETLAERFDSDDRSGAGDGGWSTRIVPGARCTCAHDGHAGRCPFHTQEDFDLAEAGRLMGPGSDRPVEPALPYAGTSGWSGSETSRSTVVDQDNDGRTLDKQQRTLTILDYEHRVHGDKRYVGRSFGYTWRELDGATGWGHGSTSRVLSDLHKAGLLCRLSEVRNRCKVYVLPEYVGGRETEPHGGRGGDRLTVAERGTVNILRVWLGDPTADDYNTNASDLRGGIENLLDALDRLAPEPKD